MADIPVDTDQGMPDAAPQAGMLDFVNGMSNQQFAAMLAEYNQGEPAAAQQANMPEIPTADMGDLTNPMSDEQWAAFLAQFDQGEPSTAQQANQAGLQTGPPEAEDEPHDSGVGLPGPEPLSLEDLLRREIAAMDSPMGEFDHLL